MADACPYLTVFSSQISAFAPLLDRVDITDVIITADALHTQRAHAELPLTVST